MIRIKQKLVHVFFLALLLAMFTLTAVMGTAVTQSALVQSGEANPAQLIASDCGSNGSCGGG